MENIVVDSKVNDFITGAICVDFDGVIAEFSDDIRSFGSIIPGAVNALEEFRRLGYRIIIHTARPADNSLMRKFSNYLTTAGVPFDEINTNSECDWRSIKPLADLYIDDRALRFEGDWSACLESSKRILGIDTPPSTELEYDFMLSMILSRKKQVATFENFLREKTNWLTAPASTRFHLAEEGGLIKHSINVANTLLKMKRTLSPELTDESCVIIGLYHDVGKVGMPGNPYYIANDKSWNSRRFNWKYTINPEIVHMDIATRSLYHVGRFIDLTDQEIQAIRYHDGQYIPENRSVAHRECPLTRLLQYADNWSGGVLEKEGSKAFN